MNPIFFPSTWIPESFRGLLFACFGQVTVLQPSRKLLPESLRRLEEIGRLNICLPYEESDEGAIEDLPSLLRGYHVWADLHQGERPAFHKFARLYSSGPDDTSTTWIRSKIRNPEGENTDEGIPGGDATDPLLMSRLFMAIAQEYDRQDESLSRDLCAIDNMERNLLRDLSPDQPSPGEISTPSPSPDEVATAYPMSAQRLAAWRHLFSHLQQSKNPHMPAPATFFVTGDREATHLVLDSVDTPEAVCKIVGIPYVGEEDPFVSTADHQRIDKALREAVQGSPLSSSTILFSENKTCPENTGVLTIYRLKGNPVAVGLSGSERILESSPAIPTDDESPFSLLGYIENCTLDSPK